MTTGIRKVIGLGDQHRGQNLPKIWQPGRLPRGYSTLPALLSRASFTATEVREGRWVAAHTFTVECFTVTWRGYHYLSLAAPAQPALKQVRELITSLSSAWGSVQ